MHVCVLEHPRILSDIHFNDIANTPLWSCLMGGYVASAIEAEGHKVTFIDTTVNGWDFEKTCEGILNLAPDALFVNAVYFWEHTYIFFEFVKELRKKGFHNHINLFGFFPTLAFDAILENYPEIDSVAIGECENTLCELTECLSNGSKLENIPGLAYLKDDKVVFMNKRRPHRDPDTFHYPARQIKPGDTASVLASRGCYNHCIFCPVPSFYNSGSLWTGRSPMNVYQEILMLGDMGIRDFYFVDPNFIGPGKSGKMRTLELLELTRPLGINFGMETRPGDLDEEIFEKLVESGLTSLLLGIESGSPNVLGGLNKFSSLNTSEQAIKICRSFGIEPEIGFLMFVPDSTIEDIECNLEFLRKNNLLDRMERTANLLGHRHIVFKGTSGFDMFKKQGRLEKTGFLGFQGEVSYKDKRVLWLADVVVHACLYVLKETADPGSVVYWADKDNNGAGAEVNDYLTRRFVALLELVSEKNIHISEKEIKAETEKELNVIFHKRNVL